MRGLLTLALAYLMALPAAARFTAFQYPTPAGGATYSGPGDVKASATMWGGLRAYSAATAGNSALDLMRASDSTACTGVKTKASDGTLDVASGTPCPGSTTVTSWCNATSCGVTKLYDQTGNGNHWVNGGAQSTLPVLTLSCTTVSKPCMTFTAASVQCMRATVSNIAQSATYSVVVKSTSTNTGEIIETNAGSYNWQIVPNFGSAGTLLSDGGTTSLTAAFSNNAWHALQGVMNGASSSLGIDGASTSGNAGSLGTGTTIDIGRDNCGGAGAYGLDGTMGEVGIWPVAFSAGDITSMNSNQHTFWGF